MKNSAFSLIELMIVIAIVGILSIVAIPSYAKYMEKSSYVAAINLAEPFVQQTNEYRFRNGVWPQNLQAMGYPSSNSDFDSSTYAYFENVAPSTYSVSAYVLRPSIGSPCPSGASNVVANIGIIVDGNIDNRQVTTDIFIGETPSGMIVKYCTVNILDDNVDLYLTCDGEEDDGTNGTEFYNKICGI